MYCVLGIFLLLRSLADAVTASWRLPEDKDLLKVVDDNSYLCLDGTDAWPFGDHPSEFRGGRLVGAESAEYQIWRPLRLGWFKFHPRQFNNANFASSEGSPTYMLVMWGELPSRHFELGPPYPVLQPGDRIGLVRPRKQHSAVVTHMLSQSLPANGSGSHDGWMCAPRGLYLTVGLCWRLAQSQEPGTQ